MVFSLSIGNKAHLLPMHFADTNRFVGHWEMIPEQNPIPKTTISGYLMKISRIS